MALTQFQRDVLQLIAGQRKRDGESYVAGGVALNVLTLGSRRSRDIDLFHDSAEALQKSWDSDRRLLESSGFQIHIVRERPAFVEVIVSKEKHRVVLEWSQDSAYRFFPLVEHAELGLTLHPIDLATNKVLALVGRREVRDFVDVVRCDEMLQPLGFLAWAAAGKDPGFSPMSILEEAARSVRYSQLEVDALDYEGPAPNASALAKRWHEMLVAARDVVSLLPPEHAGQCVLGEKGDLLLESPGELRNSLPQAHILFHPGSIRGSWPQIR